MLVAVASITGTSTAQDPRPRTEVTVEATRVDALLPARTEIEREELIDSHKNDLGAVLDLTPGLNVRDGGRGEPRLDVRGFDQRAVLFTLNGVPIYEPWNGVINLNLFPLEMLDSVEVDRGPSSALYGPNGMAGTVKLRTMRSAAPITASGSTIWRDSHFWDTRASAAVSRNRLSAVVGGRFLNSDGYPLTDDFDDQPESRRRWEDGGRRIESDRNEQSGFAHLGYEYAESGRAYASFLGPHAKFGIPPSTTSFLGPFRRTDHENLLHAQAGFDQHLTARMTAAAGVFYTRYETQEGLFDSAAFNERTLTTSAESSEVGTIGRLTADITDADILAIAMQVRRSGAGVVDSMRGHLVDPAFTTSSIAAENVYLLADRISLVIGLSVDLQRDGRSTRAEANPQAGFSIDSGNFGTTRGAVGRKIRFPTLRELFDPIQGNSSLEPESAILYEVGHRVSGSHTYFDLNCYRSDVDGLIENEGGDSGQAVNLQRATLRGFELAAGASFSWVRLDVNYTFLDTAAPTTGGAGTGHSEIQHRPRHRFNGILHLLLPYALTVRTEGIYNSAPLDRFGSDVRVDPYTQLNLQVSKRFGDQVQLFTGVDNVLDEAHEDKLGAPGHGRWIFAGIRLAYP